MPTPPECDFPSLAPTTGYTRGCRCERCVDAARAANPALDAALRGYEQVERRYVEELRAKGLAFAPRGAGAERRAGLRERLAGDLRRILHEAGTTALMVTHDQEEAFAVADRIALLRVEEP